jgi:hypothetical protein
MHKFIEIVVGFPTVLFSFFVALSMLYWLSSFFGLVEIDALDVELPELDGHMALNHESSFGEMFAGLLLRFGLNGVPVTLVITVVSIFGWVFCYYLSYLSVALFGQGWVRFVTGIPIAAVSLYTSVMVSAVAIRPLRRFFAKVEQVTEKKVLGQVAVVRSSRVDGQFGEVNFDDGGAGMIFKARSTGDSVFARGDKVVLLEYVSAGNYYRVISEEEFMGLPKSTQNN